MFGDREHSALPPNVAHGEAPDRIEAAAEAVGVPLRHSRTIPRNPFANPYGAWVRFRTIDQDCFHSIHVFEAADFPGSTITVEVGEYRRTAAGGPDKESRTWRPALAQRSVDGRSHSAFQRALLETISEARAHLLAELHDPTSRPSGRLA